METLAYRHPVKMQVGTGRRKTCCPTAVHGVAAAAAAVADGNTFCISQPDSGLLKADTADCFVDYIVAQEFDRVINVASGNRFLHVYLAFVSDRKVCRCFWKIFNTFIVNSI